jgi:GDSL-like Lipase/Acylhydrolase family
MCRRFVHFVIAGLVLVASMFATGTALAVNAPPPAGGTPNSYVALGDSYSSGEGLSPFISGSDTSSDQCHRSARSYPYLLASAFDLSPFHDYACSGATTEDVDESTQFGPEGDPQAFHSPLKHADLVTIGVGGDDLGFSGDLKYCLEHRYCQTITSFASKVDQAFAALPGKLDDAYDAIREHKRKDATVIVVGYPRLFPTIKSHQQCQIIHGHFGYGFEDSEQDYFNAKAIALDHDVAAAAKRAGFFYVSPLRLFLGHAPCDPDPWINGISDHEGSHVTFDASFHPNSAGQSEYAALIERKISNYKGKRNKDGLPKDRKATRHLPSPPPSCRPGTPCPR